MTLEALKKQYERQIHKIGMKEGILKRQIKLAKEEFRMLKNSIRFRRLSKMKTVQMEFDVELHLHRVKIQETGDLLRMIEKELAQERAKAKRQLKQTIRMKQKPRLEEYKVILEQALEQAKDGAPLTVPPWPYLDDTFWQFSLEEQILTERGVYNLEEQLETRRYQHRAAKQREAMSLARKELERKLREDTLLLESRTSELEGQIMNLTRLLSKLSGDRYEITHKYNQDRAEILAAQSYQPPGKGGIQARRVYLIQRTLDRVQTNIADL